MPTVDQANTQGRVRIAMLFILFSVEVTFFWSARFMHQVLHPLDTMVHRTRALDNSNLLSDARGQLLVSYITEHVT